MTGRSPWQLLDGADSEEPRTHRLLYADAPHGVGHFVASWTQGWIQAWF